jgi:hypothetical protein
MQNFINNYIFALKDNFNTPEALAIFHEFLSFVNIGIRDDKFSI